MFVCPCTWENQNSSNKYINRSCKMWKFLVEDSDSLKYNTLSHIQELRRKWTCTLFKHGFLKTRLRIYTLSTWAFVLHLIYDSVMIVLLQKATCKKDSPSFLLEYPRFSKKDCWSDSCWAVLKDREMTTEVGVSLPLQV